MSTLASGARAGSTKLRGHFTMPLFRHAYTLLLGSASISALGLLYWLIAARVYPADVVGLGSAAISVLMFVSGISQLGLTSILVRYLPSASGSATRLVLWSYAATTAVSALAGITVALAIGRIVPDLEFLGSNAWWLAGFTLSTVCWSLFALQDSVLTALRQTLWVTIENTIFAVAKILLLVILASSITSPGALFTSWVLPAVLAVVLVNVFVFTRALPRHRRESRKDAPQIPARRLLRFASGNYAGSGISLAALYVMPVLVASTAGASATAYFYVPWSIFIGLQLVAMNMTTSLTVEVARDEDMLAEYCHRALVQTLRLLVPVSLLLLVAAPYLLRVFGGAYASEGTSLLRVLAVATIPNAVVLVGISVARLRHQGWLVLGGQALMAAVGVGVSYALIPVLGLEGAGLAWLCAQLAAAAAFLVGPFRIPIRLGRRPAPATH